MLKQRERLRASLSSQSVDEVERANETFKTYVDDNALRDAHDGFVANYGKPPTQAAPQALTLEQNLGIREKSRFLIAGSDQDLVVLYNASPSAPSVAKDIRGNLTFLTDSASLCFAQSPPDEGRIWFVERLLRAKGATEIKRRQQPCDVAQDSVFVDFIVFNRGELLKQNVMYVQELVKLIENDTFREYQTTAAGDYDAEVQDRHALSLKIGQEIETGHRAGYGIVTVTDAALPVCIISTGRADHLEGLKELLLRKRIEISMKTRHDWPLLEMTEGMAFIALMRRQCGFLAGEANGLKAVVKALRREDKLYEFVPVWFDTDEIAKVGADIIRKRDQAVRDQKDRDLIRVSKQRRSRLRRKLSSKN